MVGVVAAGFDEAGVEFGRAQRNGLNVQITLVPVRLVKGLELDAPVVVEPAAILEEEVQGARAPYVSLTRATQRLVLVHEPPPTDVLEADGVDHRPPPQNRAGWTDRTKPP